MIRCFDISPLTNVSDCALIPERVSDTMQNHSIRIQQLIFCPCGKPRIALIRLRGLVLCLYSVLGGGQQLRGLRHCTRLPSTGVRRPTGPLF